MFPDNVIICTKFKYAHRKGGTYSYIDARTQSLVNLQENSQGTSRINAKIRESQIKQFQRCLKTKHTVPLK